MVWLNGWERLLSVYYSVELCRCFLKCPRFLAWLCSKSLGLLPAKHYANTHFFCSLLELKLIWGNFRYSAVQLTNWEVSKKSCEGEKAPALKRKGPWYSNSQTTNFIWWYRCFFFTYANGSRQDGLLLRRWVSVLVPKVLFYQRWTCSTSVLVMFWPDFQLP